MGGGELIAQYGLMYIVLIGAGIGVILGLIPLIVSIKKGKMKFGLFAVVSSAVAGILGIISIGIILPLIVVAIFLWLTLKKDETPRNNSLNESDSNRS